jgi:HAD superfamily phosphatase (TIGR01668 family)
MGPNDENRPHAGDDWLLTLRQTLPRLGQVLGNMQPTQHLPDVNAITSAMLEQQGIRSIIWDVDGTLMSYHARAIAPVLRSQVESLFSDSRLSHAILSNCDERRFDELKEIFPSVPIVRAYTTADGPVYRTAIAQRDTHTRDQVQEILSSGGRQIRKPSRLLVDHAIEQMQATSHGSVVVGDQYLTDVASANLARVRSIKVQTFARKTFPKSIQTTQRLESLLYRLRHGRPKP